MGQASKLLSAATASTPCSKSSQICRRSIPRRSRKKSKRISSAILLFSKRNVLSISTCRGSPPWRAPFGFVAAAFRGGGLCVGGSLGAGAQPPLFPLLLAPYTKPDEISNPLPPISEITHPGPPPCARFSQPP